MRKKPVRTEVMPCTKTVCRHTCVAQGNGWCTVLHLPHQYHTETGEPGIPCGWCCRLAKEER